MGSPMLDLAFAMDCTGSMGSYIQSATRNIRSICEEIVASEQVMVNLALVEYRDHPPQESSFVTRVHDFSTVSRMKTWLDACTAEGGGDEPEAVADAMHELLKLSWRPGAAKLAILVSDAPPHGVGCRGDSMPNGCPLGHDPMAIARQLVQQDITLYVVGVEPSVLAYRDFFTALAYVTGGQYVPLSDAQVLAKAVIAGAREEISLVTAMAEVRLEVERDMQMAPNAMGQAQNAYEDAVTCRVHDALISKGITTKKVVVEGQEGGELMQANKQQVQLSRCENLEAVRHQYPLIFPEAQRTSSESHAAKFCLTDSAPMPLRCGSAAMPASMSRRYVADGSLFAASLPPPAPGGMWVEKGTKSFDMPDGNPALSAPPCVAASAAGYDVAESSVSYGQTSRMVRKVLAKVAPPSAME